MSDKEIQVNLNKVDEELDANEELELDEAALKKKKIEERRKYLTDTYVKKTKPVIEDRKIIPIINGVPVRKSFDSDDESDSNVGNNEKSSYGQVMDKYVRDLTQDERAIIIKNYTDGIKNDNYDVKMLKNGNPSITRKRGGKPKSINDEIIKEAGKTSGRVGNLTTEQFMIQNFLDLENRFTKMKSKQKRLKKKYKKLKGDIYIDNEEIGESIEVKANEDIERDQNIGQSVDENNLKQEVEQEMKQKLEQNNVQENMQNNVQEPVQYQNYGRRMTFRERLLLQRGLI